MGKRINRKKIYFNLNLILRGKGQNLVAGLGDQERVLPLSARFAIGCARCPSIFFIDHSCAHSRIDHRLDRERHTRRQRNGDIVVMVRNLGRFMKTDADAVAHEKIDDAAPMSGGVIFDHLPNLTNRQTWF